VWGVISAGVGVAGIVGFGVLGSLNNSLFEELRADCRDNHCPPDREQDIRRGQLYQLAANASLGAGLVGLGVSAYLLLSGHGSERADLPRTVVLPHPGALAVRGRF
jgi:hypothetical protein